MITKAMIRDQISTLEALGVHQLEARMAIVPRLWARSRGELDAAWRLPAGRYRDKRVEESCGFWQRFWSVLRTHLEGQDCAAAAAEIDKAVERVEPWGAQNSNAEDAETRGGRSRTRVPTYSVTCWPYTDQRPHAANPGEVCPRCGFTVPQPAPITNPEPATQNVKLS